MNYPPFTICWLFIPLIFIFGEFAVRNEPFDLQLHDTYFAIAGLPLILFISLVMIVLGLGYWFVSRMKGRLVRPLTIIHLVATIGGFVLLLTCLAITSTFTNQQSSFLESFQSVSYGISIALLSILLAQPIYLLNLAIGLYRNTR